jgi:hypothetical protein
MRKTLVLVLVVAALVASAAMLLAACGGGTATYTNDEYGFSFDYDSGMFTQTDDTSAAGSVGGNSVFTTGFFDKNGTKSDDQYRDGFVVTLYKLNVTIDESMMPAVQAELEKLLPELGKAFGSGAEFSALEEVTVNGIPGFTADATYEMEGTSFKATLYFLIKGNMEYSLNMQGAEDRWSELEPGFQQVIDTFTVK